MPYIPSSVIEIIKRLTEEKNLEWCGSLKQEDGDEYTIEIKLKGDHSRGKDGFIRGVCSSPHAVYKWHTHARDHLAYPSYEDIHNVIKDPPGINICHLLFTPWGIWDMKCRGKRPYLLRYTRDIAKDYVEKNIEYKNEEDELIHEFSFFLFNLHEYYRMNIDEELTIYLDNSQYRSLTYGDIDAQDRLATRLAREFCENINTHVFRKFKSDFYMKFTPYSEVGNDYYFDE